MAKWIAYTLGEPVSDDTFVVHIEKAYADIRRCLYHDQCSSSWSIEVKDYTYVNREEDTGDEGLRTAKLSYRPVFMVEKGIVTLKGE